MKTLGLTCCGVLIVILSCPGNLFAEARSREEVRHALITQWGPGLLAEQATKWLPYIRNDDKPLKTEKWITHLKKAHVSDLSKVKNRAIVRVLTFRLCEKPDKLLEVYKELPLELRYPFLDDLNYVGIEAVFDASYAGLFRALIKDLITLKERKVEKDGFAAARGFVNKMQWAVRFLARCGREKILVGSKDRFSAISRILFYGRTWS